MCNEHEQAAPVDNAALIRDKLVDNLQRRGHSYAVGDAVVVAHIPPLVEVALRLVETINAVRIARAKQLATFVNVIKPSEEQNQGLTREALMYERAVGVVIAYLDEECGK